MKIGKFKIQLNSLSSFGGGLILLVLILSAGITGSKIQAQSFSDLTPAAQQELSSLFQTEMELIRQEALNPPQGVSVVSNRNIFTYYQNILSSFESGSTILRDAFIENLPSLLSGPVRTHPLIETSFYSSLNAAPAPDWSELIDPASGQSTGVDKSAVTTGPDSWMYYFATKDPFRTHLREMEVNSHDLSGIKDIFEYIRSNK